MPKIGSRFGRLIVISKNDNRKRWWLCKCDCGKIVSVQDSSLYSGGTKSCKCLRNISNEEYDKRTKERLEDSIKKENGCWIWIKALSRQKYGSTVYRSKHYLAHRLSWKMYKGNIPENMDVCHKCDNPKCINPDHLFLGTHSDNMKDAFRKNRKNHQGENHPLSKLKDIDIPEIFKLFKTGFSKKYIADKFKVTQTAIHRVLKRLSWAHIKI